MRIELEQNSSNGIAPCCPEVLLTGDENFLHNEEHGFRHPLGIYNKSIGRLLESFESVVDNLKAVNDVDKNEEGRLSEQLADSQRELIRSMNSHFDNLNNIMQCFIPKSEVSGEGPRSTIEWIERAGYSQQDNFYQDTKDFQNRIKTMHNALKHDNRDIRVLKFFDPLQNFGYYIEGVHQDGAIGPDPEIHEDGNTAFSFNRDIRLNLYILYEVMTKFEDYLNNLVQDINGSLPTDNSHSYPDNEEWESLFEEITDLTIEVFPNEEKMSFPKIRYYEESGEVLLQYPSNLEPLQVGGFKIMMTTQPDGVSTTYKLPYGISRMGGVFKEEID